MRSDRCGVLRGEDVGRRVRLAGWVHRLRDLGGITFVDMRDASGIVQVTCRDLDQAHRLSREDVLQVEGTVALREAANPELPTGEVEVEADAVRVISHASPLPFTVDEEATGTTEETRLRFRSVDLRRPRMQKNLALRHRVCMGIRRYLDEQGFIEVETPVLTRSTPEGARDFLVPSRLSRGRFYALPQSPQLFKQILVSAGVERYFQIVRCFRDEDLRADRQPEFTQLDLEMGFLDDPNPLLALLEGLMAYVFRETIRTELATPFPRLTYAQAMSRYGSDKPDLRFGMELIDLSDLFAGAGFRVFARAVADGGQVRALRVPGGAELSRGELDKVEEEAVSLGAPGLSWLKRTEGLSSPLAKFVGEEVLREVADRMGMGEGDLVLLSAGTPGSLNPALGELRTRLARSRGLVPEGQWAPAWITDFPLFKPGEDGGLESEHHPFTSPHDEDIDSLEAEPLRARAKCYDLVLNGVELASGSIRIHRRDVQQRILSLVGIDAEEAERRFGFFLRALDYGVPPHGGIAFGLDRWVMMLAGEKTLREVIAFPKTAGGACPLTGAPAPVDEAQLDELGLVVKGWTEDEP